MKKTYEYMEISLVFFPHEDIVRTSQNDNISDMPEFPENFAN